MKHFSSSSWRKFRGVLTRDDSRLYAARNRDCTDCDFLCAALGGRGEDSRIYFDTMNASPPCTNMINASSFPTGMHAPTYICVDFQSRNICFPAVANPWYWNYMLGGDADLFQKTFASVRRFFNSWKEECFVSCADFHALYGNLGRRGAEFRVRPLSFDARKSGDSRMSGFTETSFLALFRDLRWRRIIFGCFIWAGLMKRWFSPWIWLFWDIWN